MGTNDYDLLKLLSEHSSLTEVEARKELGLPPAGEPLSTPSSHEEPIKGKRRGRNPSGKKNHNRGQSNGWTRSQLV